MEIKAEINRNGLSREFRADELNVLVYKNRDLLGVSVAKAVATQMRKVIEENGKVRVVFASAPSQNDFLKHIKEEKGIDWSKVYAFHMDNYVGLPIDHEQSFSQFLVDRLFKFIPEANFYPIDSAAENPEEEVKRYKALLTEAPIDIMILGIGESGHLAFIDPPYCDFDDDAFFKVSPLDEETLIQQVHDGCFEKAEDVPQTAYTLTIGACIASPFTVAIVPTKLKAPAIQKVLEGPITTAVPASVLQKKKNTWLFLDTDSASLISKF